MSQQDQEKLTTGAASLQAYLKINQTTAADSELRLSSPY